MTAEPSTAIVKTDRFEAIRLVVPAGQEIRRHAVPGHITLHCLEGHVELGLDGTAIALRANDWTYLDGGAAHSLKGLADSLLLLTILFAPGDAGPR